MVLLIGVKRLPQSLQNRQLPNGFVISERKKQIKVLFTQKVKDLSNAHGNEDIVNETYDALQQDILSQIHGLELQLKELNDTSLENEDVKEKLENALQVVDKIIEKGILDRKENEIIYQTMRLIYEEERGYTSAKYLSKALTD